MAYTKEEVLRHLGGTPEQVDKELRAVTAAAKVLSSDHPRLIDQYPQRWVGVYQGHVAADADSLEALLDALRVKHIPAEKTIVRFIDTTDRMLIL